MAELFGSGRLVDVVLVVVALEALLLMLFWKFYGRGVAPGDLLPTLCAGALLLLALRVTLAGWDWPIPCACLAAAGLSHLVDVARRWRSHGPG
jgi:hypothetical protein